MSEEWECPICKKTVMVGYTVHIHCLDELISEFVKDLEEIRICYIFKDKTKWIERVLDKKEKWEEKLK